MENYLVEILKDGIMMKLMAKVEVDSKKLILELWQYLFLFKSWVNFHLKSALSS